MVYGILGLAFFVLVLEPLTGGRDRSSPAA